MNSTLTWDTESDLKKQALDAMQAAWKALRRMEDMSDDKSESKAAGKAVASLNAAFAAIERGK